MNASALSFALIGGLGFFFYGMQLMSDGLKQIAGERLKGILHMATKIPLVGILVGALVTCLIQSSSATTVMVVGFVNAGLLVLSQAISVIMGANIGTTFTAWLVSSMSLFKVTNYALPAVGIGFALMKLGRTRKARFSGQVIVGFGLLFMGLDFMKDAFSPLKDSLYFKDLFIRFADDPLLGVLVGMVFTVLLQSSSATIAIVQVLAFNGIIGFPAALPIIVGGNIGTTITAQLAAIGTNVTARRAAMSHTLFNVIGVGYTMIFLYTGLFARGVEWAIPGVVTPRNVMFYLAVSHSIFNIVNTIVFLPFIGLLEKVSVWLVPQHKGAIDMRPQYLEKHLLDTPPIALEQAKQETVRMLSLAKQSVSTAVFSFITPNAGAGKSVEQLEEAVDNLQSEITQYLIELSQRSLAEAETEEIPVLIHSVNDIERIGDHSENIIDLVLRKEEERLPFSDSAFSGLSQMWDTLLSMMEKTESALHKGDIAVAHEVLALEEQINQFQKDLKRGHVERLGRGECQIKSGVIFMDMVDNLEKIGDHLTNIAQAVIGELRWHESKSAVFL